MAIHWTRELIHTAGEPRNGFSLWVKQIVMMMYHIGGFTNFSESVSGGTWDPTSFTKSGSDGYFTGSDKRFTDNVASSFTVTDTGSYILIKDTTYPRNSGWYKMTYVDSSNIDLDFRSGATEYPDASGGLSWWTLDKLSGFPAGNGDYCRIRGDTGWEIEFKNYYHVGQWQRTNIDIRVSMDGDWSGSGKIVGSWRYGTGSTYETDISAEQVRYMIVDTDASTIIFWQEFSVDGGNIGFAHVPVIPYESIPPRDNTEKYAMAGSGYGPTVIGTNLISITWAQSGNRYWGDGVRHWNEQNGGNDRELWPIDYSRWASAQGLIGWTGREINARSGRWDVLNGIPMWADISNSNNEHTPFASMGEINNLMFTIPGWSVAVSPRAALDIDSADGYAFHISYGIGVIWPLNITPQY